MGGTGRFMVGRELRVVRPDAPLPRQNRRACLVVGYVGAVGFLLAR